MNRLRLRTARRERAHRLREEREQQVAEAAGEGLGQRGGLRDADVRPELRQALALERRLQATGLPGIMDALAGVRTWIMLGKREKGTLM